MDTSSKENIQLFCKNSMQPIGGTSFKTEYSSSKKKQPCCGELKVFLSALSFVYFAKALAGGYLKSTITQIERRFEIPSSLVGVIDGSFEIGRYYRCPISLLNTTSSSYDWRTSLLQFVLSEQPTVSFLIFTIIWITHFRVSNQNERLSWRRWETISVSSLEICGKCLYRTVIYPESPVIQ